LKRSTIEMLQKLNKKAGVVDLKAWGPWYKSSSPGGRGVRPGLGERLVGSLARGPPTRLQKGGRNSVRGRM